MPVNFQSQPINDHLIKKCDLNHISKFFSAIFMDYLIFFALKAFFFLNPIKLCNNQLNSQLEKGKIIIILYFFEWSSANAKNNQFFSKKIQKPYYAPLKILINHYSSIIYTI
jgi:hypothetical protein